MVWFWGRGGGGGLFVCFSNELNLSDSWFCTFESRMHCLRPRLLALVAFVAKFISSLLHLLNRGP